MGSHGEGPRLREQLKMKKNEKLSEMNIFNLACCLNKGKLAFTRANCWTNCGRFNRLVQLSFREK